MYTPLQLHCVQATVAGCLAIGAAMVSLAGLTTVILLALSRCVGVGPGGGHVSTLAYGAMHKIMKSDADLVCVQRRGLYV